MKIFCVELEQLAIVVAYDWEETLIFLERGHWKIEFEIPTSGSPSSITRSDLLLYLNSFSSRTIRSIFVLASID